MSIRRSLLLAAGAALVFGVGALLLNARDTAARPSVRAGTPASVAQRLVGRWTGPKYGAEANRFRADRWELIFERSSRSALIGRKRHRENGDWSAYERIDAVVDPARRIWAVDEDGTINGVLRGNTLDLVYLEPGMTDASAATIRLRRVR
jgi:hypothetical protein